MNTPLWYVCSGLAGENPPLEGLMTGWPEDDRGNSHTPRVGAENRKMWQGGWTVINIGEPWKIPGSVIEDFFILRWKNSEGKEVITQSRPARFKQGEEFLGDEPEKNHLTVSKNNPLGGQSTDITDLPDGDYDLTVEVNPVYGESAPNGISHVAYTIEGENCNVRKPIMFGTFKL